MLSCYYINPIYSEALNKAEVLVEEVLSNWNLGEQVVKKGHSSLFRHVIPGIGNVYIKKYIPNTRKWLRSLRTSNAIRECKNSFVMSRLGIEQPESVLACVVRDGLRRTRCGVYITREVEDAAPLSTILNGISSEYRGHSLEEIARSVLEVLDILHNNKYCHWDFKPRNILVAKGQEGPRIIPIDSRSLSRIYFLNRKAYIRRDYKFLMQETLIRDFMLNH